MNCSVVIPVYRGEHTLELLLTRLADVLPACAEEFEVLLVNDGSPDHSWDVIEALTQRYSWVRGIKVDAELRSGKCNAVRHPRSAR